jgi:hypothetical protein
MPNPQLAQDERQLYLLNLVRGLASKDQAYSAAYLIHLKTNGKMTEAEFMFVSKCLNDSSDVANTDRRQQLPLRTHPHVLVSVCQSVPRFLLLHVFLMQG